MLFFDGLWQGITKMIFHARKINPLGRWGTATVIAVLFGFIVFLTMDGNSSDISTQTCGQPTDDSSSPRLNSTQEFYDFVEEIAATHHTPISAEGYLFSDRFVYILENPDPYLGCVLNILEERDLSHNEQLVTIYSMNRLSLQDYITFAEESYLLFKSGDISEDLLKRVLGYPFLRPPLLVNYKHPDVQEFYEYVIAEEEVSEETRNLLSKSKNGETWKNPGRPFYRWLFYRFTWS